MGWKWKVRERAESRGSAKALPQETSSTGLPFVESEESGKSRPASDQELGFGHAQFAVPER